MNESNKYIGNSVSFETIEADDNFKYLKLPNLNQY